MTDENLPVTAQPAQQPAPLLAFSSIENFEAAQRMAKSLAASDMVPTMYKGEKGIANCLIAMEVSARTGSSILAVVQNLHVIQGRPSWSASYIIAAINSCGRFHPLSMTVDGEGDKRGCSATATVIRTGEVAEGPRVDIAMAKAEGWHGKAGSKWKTMPDLMLRYRAASMFGRLYAPEILMGMQTDEESEDIAPPTVLNPNEARDVPVEVVSNGAPDGAEQNAAPDDGVTVPKPRRKRRSKEQIEAEKNMTATEVAARAQASAPEAGQEAPPPLEPRPGQVLQQGGPPQGAPPKPPPIQAPEPQDEHDAPADATPAPETSPEPSTEDPF